MCIYIYTYIYIHFTRKQNENKKGNTYVRSTYYLFYLQQLTPVNC